MNAGYELGTVVEGSADAFDGVGDDPIGSGHDTNEYSADLLSCDAGAAGGSDDTMGRWPTLHERSSVVGGRADLPLRSGGNQDGVDRGRTVRKPKGGRLNPWDRPLDRRPRLTNP
jgi:hypothetical protein